MTTTPRLALPYILSQQAQKEVTHAAALNQLDALVQPVVQQVGLNTPPGSPTDGQCWIVGTTPTGAWVGQANRLAQRIGGAWVFHTPFVGLVVLDVATLTQRMWNASAWMLLSPRIIEGSVAYDPPGLAAGEVATTTVSVPGAAVGGFAHVSFDVDVQGVTLTAWVSAADTVSVNFQNGTASAIYIGNGSLRVRVDM